MSDGAVPEGASYTDYLLLLAGGPMLWACKASAYLRPVVDDLSDDEGSDESLWRCVMRDGASLDASAYLRRLGFEDGDDSCRAVSRGMLDELIKRHVERIPFENLDVFGSSPSEARTICLAAAYDKVVVRGRGGLCFELNLLFGWLLRTLGYDARYQLARVWRLPPGCADVLPPGAEWPCGSLAAASIRREQAAAWGGVSAPSHILLRVSGLAQQSLLVDVGFGEPPEMALVDGGDQQDGQHDGRHAFRIVRQNGLCSLQRQSLGHRGLSGMLSPPGAWEPHLLLDARTSRPTAHFAPGWEWAQSAPDSLFRKQPLCVRVKRDGTKISLAGKALKVRGESTTVFDLADAAAFVAAIETHFDIPSDAHVRRAAQCAFETHAAGE
ncbi:hypothetical protein M885DRAFT_613296 [Pelagophyceae sp. CCMP2097]|nr:hypothetical protein M885DRAFT_613296 [Pelagophyceae sp. CCMP2097]